VRFCRSPTPRTGSWTLSKWGQPLELPDPYSPLLSCSYPLSALHALRSTRLRRVPRIVTSTCTLFFGELGPGRLGFSPGLGDLTGPGLGCFAAVTKQRFLARRKAKPALQAGSSRPLSGCPRRVRGCSAGVQAGGILYVLAQSLLLQARERPGTLDRSHPSRGSGRGWVEHAISNGVRAT
jgi:hypothetical protein